MTDIITVKTGRLVACPEALGQPSGRYHAALGVSIILPRDDLLLKPKSKSRMHRHAAEELSGSVASRRFRTEHKVRLTGLVRCVQRQCLNRPPWPDVRSSG